MSGAVSSSMAERLVSLHSSLTDPLLGAIEARGRDRLSGVTGLVERRREDETAKITAVLTELRQSILSELDAPPDPQLRIEALDDDERDQLERNRGFLFLRAEAIPAEVERETEALGQRYREPEARLFPVAVEYRVPRSLDQP